MIKTVDTTPKFFPIETVEATAAEMQAGDPDWTYTADYDPTGASKWARIKIEDEDGEFVAYAV